MSEPLSNPSPAPTPSQTAADPPERLVNSVEPGGRKKRRMSGEPPHAPLGVSHRAGDTPPRIARRYFTEPARFGSALLHYEGPGAKRSAFHDHGDRLVTGQTHPAIARDFAEIARHRGWSAVRLRGEDEFRRQAWLEARAISLEVQGYKPRPRDLQELEALKKAQRHGRHGADAAPPHRAPEGVILEIGRAPHRRRTDAPMTPYVRLRPSEGRPIDIWGRSLPDAISAAGARVGDRVRVTRDGIQTLERAPPENARSLAETFRRTPPAAAARRADLHAAQSHLAVMDAIVERLVQDPSRRARLQAEARSLIAEAIAEGRRFTPAQVRDVEPSLAHDVGEAARQERAAERTRRL